MKRTVGKPAGTSLVLSAIFQLGFLVLLLSFGRSLLAAPTPVVDAGPGYDVHGYVIEGRTVLSTNVLVPLFAKYAGTNVTMKQIIQAASGLETEYVREGNPTMNIVISPRRISDGIVTMSVFPGPIAQIIVGGTRYVLPESTLNAVAATAPPTAPPKKPKVEQHFVVEGYQVLGNTILPPATIAQVLTNASGAFGTNVTIAGIIAARDGLQTAYRDRGYVTISVLIPAGQRLTNNTVKLEVIEGRLAAIDVTGNHYYSSNNVMRALPGLHTNMLLNGMVFQAELNRANASQDRQIYPVVEPGPDPGTTLLTLKVKDRLPLHAKVELNDMSSPGTPLLRLNSSAVYNNLWDHEDSFGVQYGYSPRYYKVGSQWNFYDEPQVANYSAFYRMPIGNPPDLADIIAANPGNFGYDEATRRFNLPPPSGQAELNIYASRSTIDTGVEELSHSVLYDVPGVIEIEQVNYQQDLTVNNDIGGRLTTPLPSGDVRSSLSSGLDFKTYETTSSKTNDFLFTEITVNAQGQPNPPIKTTVISPVPVTHRPLEYIPLALNYNGTWHDPHSQSAPTVAFGMGLSANAWYSGTHSNLQDIAGSKHATGHWVALTPNVTVSIPLHTNWTTVVRANGQWASEPLISNEQFGAGGVNSVRGYREGEVFGDTGWFTSGEIDTPAHVVGIVYGKTPLVIRGLVYMDYAQTYLLDPQGRPSHTDLWGTGFGGVATIGPNFESRFLFSWPLLGTVTTEQYEPFFNFSLTAQF